MDEFKALLSSYSQADLEDVFCSLGGGDMLAEGNVLEGEASAIGAQKTVPKEGESGRRRAKRKARNAERCRRYRLRRQREAEELIRENTAMNEERRILQHQLSSLQREVTQLMLSQQVDLRRENEVLRNQLMTYEAYVDRVVSAVNAPLWLECSCEQEQQRAIQSVLDSAVNRLVGMMYNSMTDSSWKHGKPFPVNERIYVKWMFQLLPRGSSLENATHANLRFDAGGLPYSPETLAEYSWRHLKQAPSSKDSGALPDSENKQYWYNHSQVETVQTPKSFSTDGPIECTRIVYPVRQVEKEVLLLHSVKDAQVYPMAYMNNAELSVLEEPVLSSKKCSIILSTTAGGVIESNEASGRCVLGPGVFTKATAVTQDGEDSTGPCSRLTHLMKIGINHESRSLWENEFIFAPDGDGVSTMIKTIMRARLLKMMHDLG